MNRLDFARILDSIVVPEGVPTNEIRKQVFPISQASYEMLPRSLFRYRPIGNNQIQAFEEDIIYTVTADRYNDPYDTLVKCDVDRIKEFIRRVLSVESLTQLKAYIQQGKGIPEEIKRGSPNASWDVIEARLLATDDISSLQSDIDCFLAQFSSLIDVMLPIISKKSKQFAAYACFSEVVDSILMWSHYAESHKGFVLEYDFRPTLAKPIKNTLILPVVYSDERLDASAYMVWALITMMGGIMGGKIPNPDMLAHIKVALHKSMEWEYEKEWRMIEGTPRMNPLDNTPSPVIYKPVAIYYGCEMTPEKKRQLHEIAATKGIREYEMYIDLYSSKYEMKYREVGGGIY